VQYFYLNIHEVQPGSDDDDDAKVSL